VPPHARDRVEEGEQPALAAAAARILDDADLAATLRTAGPERARAFDWSTTVGRIEDAYRDALAIGQGTG